MIRSLIVTATLACSLAGSVWAETFEVKMLNKGENGRMVYEPASLQINVGDTVKFIPTNKSHNAETVKGMIPEGAEPFKSKVNKEFEVTLDVEGLYAIKCKPHFSMGMVMTIAVGDAGTSEDFFKIKVPSRAKKRYKEQLAELGR